MEGKTHFIPFIYALLFFFCLPYPYPTIINILMNFQEACMLYRGLGRGESNGGEISRKKGDKYTRISEESKKAETKM